MEKATAPSTSPEITGQETHTAPQMDAQQVPQQEAQQQNARLALQHQHLELERQLAALDRHLSLTPDEQIEQRRLKKEKLRVKDQLLRLGLPSARGA